MQEGAKYEVKGMLKDRSIKATIMHYSNTEGNPQCRPLFAIGTQTLIFITIKHMQNLYNVLTQFCFNIISRSIISTYNGTCLLWSPCNAATCLYQPLILLRISNNVCYITSLKQPPVYNSHYNSSPNQQ